MTRGAIAKIFPDEFWSELELLNPQVIDIREEHPVLRADFTLSGQLSTHAYAVELVREDNCHQPRSRIFHLNRPA